MGTLQNQSENRQKEGVSRDNVEKKGNDPAMYMDDINWDGVNTGRVSEDLDQGRLLAIETFRHIDWVDLASTGISVSILSGILKKVPEGRKYERLVQGFTDEVTRKLLKAVMEKG